MNRVNNNWYKIFQALSLDVVAGAVIILLVISKYIYLQIPFSVFVCLSISIWLIYTTDHLLDAIKIKKNASTFRHQFHQKYKKNIFISGIIFFTINFVLAFYLPAIIFYGGIFLIIPIAIYLLLTQRSRIWTKEIFVAIFYTSGVFLAPICLSYKNLDVIQWLLFPQFFLLVLSNLLLFSWFEIKSDIKDEHTSIVIRLGKKITEKIITFILTAGIILNVLIIILRPIEAVIVMQIILMLMSVLLLILLKKEHLFQLNERYRVIGDGIFFIPLLFLLYAILH